MSRHPAVIEPRRRQENARHYLWDGRIIGAAHDALFEPAAWARHGALTGQAPGRGTAHFVRSQNGAQWVLRHSRRGGAAANISDDAYLWLGLSRCRVFREWQLLAELRARGLPVPAPVAARIIRRGPIYRGDLITARVANARPLSDWLRLQALAPATWRAIGATVARFHRAGLCHHDLNARNILLDAEVGVTLIDFDKSRLRRPGRWRQRNIERLRRSLDKSSAGRPGPHFSGADWSALYGGYASGAPAA